ncbi:GNAT family N-acetyltransferase [Bacillus sp. OK048]|uniref:GNAT family N-acetyltransferase n=1 Tax=Bacillus sp. OK048 TaxID=1882761 RepID=UPI000881107E|nr:GNAT family N-acetyltransferase [Bacillus sp. OK048]SDM62374.1 Ribosomal protein S18 acetylase RimI [Bacillus sp. OK048]
MIEICKANPEHVQGIAKVCSDGYRATYGVTHTQEYIERIIKEFYNTERIRNEVVNTSRHWGGYFVAVENGEVIGAGGGGMISDSVGEVFVLYLDPNRRNCGIGTKLLVAITKQQKDEFHAREQWVSIQKGNNKGIPFYEARGFTFQHEQHGYSNEEGENYLSLRYCRSI